jgi:hypothetical protein
VVKLGRGFEEVTGPSAATDVVSNYLRTSWLWEMIRVQVRVSIDACEWFLAMPHHVSCSKLVVTTVVLRFLAAARFDVGMW